MKDNGGGIVVGTEFEPTKVAATRRSVEAARLADVVDVREGDAVETLRKDLPDAVDLLFLDGAKSMYLDVLDLLEPRLGPGALVVADNASRGTGNLDRVRTSARYLSTGFESEDVEISMVLPGPG